MRANNGLKLTSATMQTETRSQLKRVFGKRSAISDAETMWTCRTCGLINPDTSTTCDCGKAVGEARVALRLGKRGPVQPGI